jgi:hypothetical protein
MIRSRRRGFSFRVNKASNKLPNLRDHLDIRSLLAITARSAVCWAPRFGLGPGRAEVELRRRRSLERVYATLLAEDYQDRADRLPAG